MDYIRTKFLRSLVNKLGAGTVGNQVYVLIRITLNERRESSELAEGFFVGGVIVSFLSILLNINVASLERLIAPVPYHYLPSAGNLFFHNLLYCLSAEPIPVASYVSGVCAAAVHQDNQIGSFAVRRA